MKKIFIVVATLILIFFSMLNVYGIQKQTIRPQNQPQTLQQTTTVPGAYEIKLPDLTVTVELVVGKYSTGDRGLCNYVEGNYTVRNVGNAASGPSKAAVLFKDELHRDWHDPGGRGNVPGLKPGESATLSCSGRLRKCPGDDFFVGWKVIADPDNLIKEMSENNNSAQKVYPSAQDALKERHPSSEQLKKQPSKTRKLN